MNTIWTCLSLNHVLTHFVLLLLRNDKAGGGGRSSKSDKGGKGGEYQVLMELFSALWLQSERDFLISMK